MESTIIFLLKASLALSIFFLIYFFFLRKEKSFLTNRYFLLGSIVLSFALLNSPSLRYFIDVDPLESSIGENFSRDGFFNIGNLISSKNQSLLVRDSKLNDKVEIVNGSQFSIWEWFCALYILIAVILLSRFIFSLLRLFFLLRSGRRERHEGIIYCYFEEKIAPFSFFNYLVVNKSQFSPVQFREVVAHEKVHIEQWHSFDVLLAEFIHCILWINPLVLAFKHYVKLNLEYLADETALNTGVDKENYQLTVLQNCLNSRMLSLANLFYSPKIKQRILMMNTTQSSRLKWYKYVCILPAILLANFFFGSFTDKDSGERAIKQSGITDWSKIIKFKGEDLSIFEGYYTYQFKKGEDSYLKIYTENNQLWLKELFTGNKVKFERKSELEFKNNEKNFPLKFTKNADGKVTHVLVFDGDLWKRIDKYEAPVKKEVLLSDVQLKEIEGSYVTKEYGGSVLEISASENILIVKPSYKGQEMAYKPESDLKFFNADPETSDAIVFEKDKKGNIIKLMRHKMVYKKVK